MDPELQEIEQATPVSLASVGSTAKQLVTVRRRLAHRMIVRVGGYEYESFFGCSDANTNVPHVVVRVGLRPLYHDSDDVYHFEVTVDFNMLQSGTVKEAVDLKRHVDRAVKLAAWAHDEVRGCVWTAETIASIKRLKRG